MAKELDLSGVDDILAQDKKEEQELDLSGVDDIMATQEAPSFLREAGETAQDFSIGAGSSMLMGAADEIGGGIGAGLETILGYVPGTSAYESKQLDEKLTREGFQVPEDTFGDKYRTYQQGSEQAFDASAERSPYANILGQFAGGMTGGHIASSALGIGKAAAGTKTLAEIAKDSSMLKALGIGAGRGATEFVKTAPYMVPELVASSKHQLIGENANPMGVAEDVGTGLAFGLPLMMGMSATSAAGSKVAGKGAEVVEKAKAAFADENNPRLRQMAASFKYGEDLGIHPRSAAKEIQQAKTLTPEEADMVLTGRLGLGKEVNPEKIMVQGDDIAFSLKDKLAADTVQEQIDSINSVLGKNVGDSLQLATERNKFVNINPDIQAAAERVQDIAKIIPELGASRKSVMAYNKMLNGQTQLTPIELKNLIDDIDSTISVFKSSANRTTQESSTLSELIRFRSSISQTLKKEVTEYRNSADQFEHWREVIEQLIAGPKDADQAGIFYGKLNNRDQKVNTALLKLIEGAASSDKASGPNRTAFTKFINKLSEFESVDGQRTLRGMNKVSPDTKEIRKFLLSASDDAHLRGSVRMTKESSALVPDLKEAIIGKAPTSGAYWAGKIAKTIRTSPKIQTAAELSRAVMKAPDNYLLNLASRLDAIGMKSTGQALKESIETGNTYKKQAALFTILQNPSAKLYINTEDFQDEKEE
jgi:hypothetical protein